MRSSVIDTYFSGVPTVLCSIGGTIAAENASAQAALPELVQGHSLLSHMTPFDALCFETACARSSDEPFFFSLQNCGGYTHAAAAFETLTERSFAAVSLFSDEMAAPPQHGNAATSRERQIAFAKLVGACDFPSEETEGLFDLRAVTQRVLRDVPAFCTAHGRDGRIFFEDETAEGSVILSSAIGMGNYMRLLMSALSALDERSANGCLTVRLLGRGGETVLHLSTPALPDKCAARDERDRLSLCAFFAKCLPVTFASIFDSASGTLELSITLASSVTGEVDLKSREQLQGYEALFSHIAALLGGVA